MIGSYTGPRPSPELWKEFEDNAEALRLNATNMGRYFNDFVQLWNSTPDVAKITSWSWEGEITPTYKRKLRNTHSAPIGKQENFTGRLDIPRGYPGIYGRVRIIFDYKNVSYGTPLGPKGLCMHSGSGNGATDEQGYYGYSFYTSIWLEDFPRIWKVYKEVDTESPVRDMPLVEFSKVFDPYEDLSRHLFDSSLSASARETISTRLEAANA